MNLIHNVKVVQLLAPQNVTATAKTTILDMAGFERAAFVVAVGAVTVDGANYLTPKVQESDTTADADFTDVDSDDLIENGLVAIDAAGDADKAYAVEYNGKKRYTRLVLTETGATADAEIAVIGLLGDPRHAPVDAPTVGTAAT